ncbi:MAG: thioredoxin-disulfide reductase [Armatimonadota bacterium]|nr:thioredoxin-disulfide reductase [Armatimonadota bacterium]MDR7438864.1 thioredoxin-disulfide reductase [Armatimonadota bacterium]MDR7562405.1 thioredoxin-disulfide reductase [Armatimonadota bacterium]MDR7568242.1 thioredoxin-disulfide reductase [Armatimonadota bacterium]MDR7601485.1 thioredoxin-disulfide reductase [Armatimonadota bacterium]
MRNVIILGSGPAGLTAAIYTARANLQPLVIEGSTPGGQLMLTTEVENFPGFADPILGPELMQRMHQQAERVGAEFLSDDAVAVDFSRRPFRITVGNGETYQAQAVIVATGARPRMLGLPSEQEYLGHGVSTCATCDGYFFRGKPVLVVGGGDTAMEEALYLANLASSVTVVHRRAELRASRILQDRAFHNPKISFLWNHVVEEILGAGGRVTGARLRHVQTGETRVVEAEGIFVAIGHIPNTDLFRGQLELDEAGYIVLKRGMMTSVEGVFAAGDVHDRTYRQAVTAAGYGCQAAIEVERWLSAQTG